MNEPKPLASAFCLRHGLEVYIQDASQLYAAAHTTSPSSSTTGSSTEADADKFMALYLTALVTGSNVLWRHYGFISGTHFNRKAFLVAAQHSLSQFTTAAGALSFGDIHSLLQLVCPDFPSSVVKNAWSSAVAIQEWVDTQKRQQVLQQQQSMQDCMLQLPEAVERVQLAVFWQCLEVTFFYEHSLLLIRKEAFDKDKRCISLQHLDAAMQRVVAVVPRYGWPVPAERCWRLAVGQASRAGTYPDFDFKDLVRALCGCCEVVKAVREELQETRTAAAAATSAAMSSAAVSRHTSSSDDAAG